MALQRLMYTTNILKIADKNMALQGLMYSTNILKIAGRTNIYTLHIA